VFRVVEEVSDWQSPASAMTWMRELQQRHQPDDFPLSGEGVERTPSVSRMGDAAFMYQIDYGAPRVTGPYSGPFVGHLYTAIDVLQGDVIFGIGIDSGPSIDAASLARALALKLLTKSTAACTAASS
jgi:hypothetical protein